MCLTQNIGFFFSTRAPAKAFVRCFGEHEITPKTLTLAFKCLFWGYSADRAGRFGESFLVSFLFPHVNQAEGAKEFELNNLARNIPQISRDCGLNGLLWQTRIGGIGDWD